MAFALLAALGTGFYAPHAAVGRSHVAAIAQERLPAVYPLDDLQAFEYELACAAADGCQMMVEFYEPHCRSCVALTRKLDQLARERPDIRLFTVNIVTAGGAAIVKTMGSPLTALPTVTMYSSGVQAWKRVVTIRDWDAVVQSLG